MRLWAAATTDCRVWSTCCVVGGISVCVVGVGTLDMVVVRG